MKVGQTVRFYDRVLGKCQDAIIVEIVGAAEAFPHFKILSLEVGKEQFKDVNHETAKPHGDMFWMLLNEPAPKSWKKSTPSAAAVIGAAATGKTPAKKE